MSKADKPTSTKSDAQRELERRINEETHLSRWRWLNGQDPVANAAYDEARRELKAKRDMQTSAAATAAVKPTKPPRWMADGLKPVERAALMIADRKIFPEGVTDLTIAAVDALLAKTCRTNHLKTWKRDTTARAMKIR